jgi:putative ABC transport system substrate-binding protein
MATSGDPVGIGLVASLARPGGNVTGNSILGPELIGKRLEILKEILPGVSRIAVLSNPTNPMYAFHVRAAGDAAKTLGVALQVLEARGPDDFERVVQAATSGRVGALLVFGDPVLTAHRTRLADLATKSRLPALYELSGFAEAGGLANYGPSLPEMFRRAAVYVDKILRGAKPADLPIEQPSKFELVINIKTAKALGLTIPQSVLARADRVLQ